MKTTTRLLCATALLGLGVAAHADMYVGAGAYSNSIDAPGFSDSDIAPAIFLGWRPTELIGVEAGYHDFGSFSDAGNDVDATAFTLAGLLSFELGPVGAYIKGGLASTEVNVNNVSDSSSDPFGGVGLSFDLADKLYVYGEYLMFTNDADADIDVLGAGIRYAF